jgi:hypothetical protein
MYFVASLNLILLILVAADFMTKYIPSGAGYSPDFYDMLISRSWVITAFISFFYALLNIRKEEAHKVLTIILIIYSALVNLFAVVLLVLFRDAFK